MANGASSEPWVGSEPPSRKQSRGFVHPEVRPCPAGEAGRMARMAHPQTRRCARPSHGRRPADAPAKRLRPRSSSGPLGARTTQAHPARQPASATPRPPRHRSGASQSASRPSAWQDSRARCRCQTDSGRRSVMPARLNPPPMPAGPGHRLAQHGFEAAACRAPERQPAHEMVRIGVAEDPGRTRPRRRAGVDEGTRRGGQDDDKTHAVGEARNLRGRAVERRPAVPALVERAAQIGTGVGCERHDGPRGRGIGALTSTRRAAAATDLRASGRRVPRARRCLRPPRGSGIEERATGPVRRAKCAAMTSGAPDMEGCDMVAAGATGAKAGEWRGAERTAFVAGPASQRRDGADAASRPRRSAGP